jgi:two-component system, cell cycle sensor histidine kinase and response regulator CckA
MLQFAQRPGNRACFCPPSGYNRVSIEVCVALIIVVDDEPVVLRTVSQTLQQAGFPVLSAASPSEALRLAVAHRSPIDLMVCDVLMPCMSGGRLAEEFRLLHPETQYLFMAGLPDHPEVRDHILARGYPFLAKPFLPRQLLAKVRSVLGLGTEGSGAGGGVQGQGL